MVRIISNHIKTIKFFPVWSSPDPPNFKNSCSPTQYWSGQNWLQSWSSLDPCSSLPATSSIPSWTQ